jgi:hypothetical protein
LSPTKPKETWNPTRKTNLRRRRWEVRQKSQEKKDQTCSSERETSLEERLSLRLTPSVKRGLKESLNTKTGETRDKRGKRVGKVNPLEERQKSKTVKSQRESRVEPNEESLRQSTLEGSRTETHRCRV